MNDNFNSLVLSIRKFIIQLWSILGLYSMVIRIVPSEVSAYVRQRLSPLQERLDLYTNIQVPEFLADGYINTVFEEAEIYLGTVHGDVLSRRLLASNPRNLCDTELQNIMITVDYNNVITDSFRGATLRWKRKMLLRSTDTMALFIIQANTADKNILKAYFEHVAEIAKELEPPGTNQRIYYNAPDKHCETKSVWQRNDFCHPSTFDTIALDPPLKDMIIRDLNRFKESRQFYAEIGRPWKRGYFIYGPPGTGKSTLVAAIANYMEYEVYDLNLNNVTGNYDLTRLLSSAWENSVIVVDNIERLAQLEDRNLGISRTSSNVTLSGMLKITDGMMSCEGRGQIFIFTARKKGTLDSALMRWGRMDVHIELSFCSFPVFRSLAKIHLDVEDHSLFPWVEERIQSGANITPAEIINIWRNKIGDPTELLQDLISALDKKIKENDISTNRGNVGSASEF